MQYFEDMWIVTHTNRQISGVDRSGISLAVLRLSFPTHRVQRGCSSHVRQETNLQHMKQEVLVVNTIHSVKEQHHRGLVVWDETG